MNVPPYAVDRYGGVESRRFWAVLAAGPCEAMATLGRPVLAGAEGKDADFTLGVGTPSFCAALATVACQRVRSSTSRWSSVKAGTSFLRACSPLAMIIAFQCSARVLCESGRSAICATSVLNLPLPVSPWV